MKGVDSVLHQTALGSVSRSLDGPIAACDAGMGHFVHAASSATYGDHPALPKREDAIGPPLSPYVVTKYVNELYADAFARDSGLESIGFPYFNVFDPRQDPNKTYAAVIPKWIAAARWGGDIRINGDGETSRDFRSVANAVQANILAATVPTGEATNQVYNVTIGERATLTEFSGLICAALVPRPSSLADDKPSQRFPEGLAEAIDSYVQKMDLLGDGSPRSPRTAAC